MNDNNNSGVNTILIVLLIIIVVLIGAWMFLGGLMSAPESENGQLDVNVDLPSGNDEGGDQGEG